MGLEGRPARSSKMRAMQRVSNQQRFETDELDNDGDIVVPDRSSRRSRRRSSRLASSDEDEDDENQPLGTGVFNGSPGLYIPPNADDDASPRKNAGATAQLSDQDQPVRQSDDDDLKSNSDNDPEGSDESDENDLDYGEHVKTSRRRSLPVRIPVPQNDGIVTKSGRISKPPRTMSPPPLPTRRPREKPVEPHLSREERYARRLRRDSDGLDILPQGQDRTPVRETRNRSAKRLSYARIDADDFDEEEEEVIGKGQEGGRIRTRRNGDASGGGRVVRMAELEHRRSTRSGGRNKSSGNLPDLDELSNGRSLRPRRTANGVGKSGRPVRNGISYGKESDGDEEAVGQADGDGDFPTPQSGEDSEEPDDMPFDGEEEALARDTREDISDDDFASANPSPRTRLRRPRKAKPAGRLPAKRKRTISRAERELNSLAREARKSFRPRRESLRPADFYKDDDHTSDTSESSGESGPVSQRPRRTRAAASRTANATAKDLGEVDYLKNPMAILDPDKGARPKHTSRYARRKSRLRPSRPDPFASDGDDGPPTNAAPIEPIQVDLDLSWDDIGGLDHHIRALKEMVFLPLMYPEIFEKFHMEPPKGVLFYGPPGTGKTLCARALAASCGAIPEQPSTPTEAAEGPTPVSPEKRTGSAEAGKQEPQAQENGKCKEDVPDVEMEETIPDQSNSSKPVVSDGDKVDNAAGMLDKEDSMAQNQAESRPQDGAVTVVQAAPIADEPTTEGSKPETDAVNASPSVTPIPKPVKRKPRVSFFMRNGADCLSKWVGEAERQLRMTFEAAKKHQPSIIFFDEIDGLAPVRSSRQDQIHSSIVSTLLGLMDGLDARGKIVVIGATNRVDAIDPALRRPGRFDRELIFTLPNLEARRRILGIHTAKWKPPPDLRVLDAVAKTTVGYCGADLKSLCSEAAIRALRRRYPQIYDSQDKLLIDVEQVRVSTRDFLAAMKEMVPASHRSARTYARPLPDRLSAVLSHPLQSCKFILKRIFPEGLGPDAVKLSGLMKEANNALLNAADAEHDLDGISSSEEDEPNLDVNAFQDKIANAGKHRATGTKTSTLRYHTLRPRILICGQPGLGQAQLGPALLHFCEGCPVHAIDYPSLHADAGARSAEEALISAFREAARSVPSILYLPHLQLWWESAPESLKTTLVIALKDLPSDLPLLVFATAEAPLNGLPAEVTELFADMFELSAPSEEHRKQLFAPLIEGCQAKPSLSLAAAKVRKHKRITEVLPKAPPPPPKAPSPEESTQKVLWEDRCIRSLRIEMRTFVESLLRDKRLKPFWDPVDPSTAPDYYQIIKIPMHITKIAAQIDSGSYPTVLAMVNDFDIMVKNAIQYNPPYTETGATILRRAHGLIDVVHAWVDNLNPALVETCNKIVGDRIARAEQRRAAAKSIPEKGSEGEEGISKGNDDVKESDTGANGKVGELADGVGQDARRAEVAAETPKVSMDLDRNAAEKRPATTTREDEIRRSPERDDSVCVRERFIAAEAEQVATLQKLLLDVSTGMTVDGLEGLYVRCEKVLHERRRSMDRAGVVKALISTVRLAREDPALVGKLVE